MSYTGDQPRVFIMNLETGQRELVGDFPNMTFAPRFSPDGQRVIMSLGDANGSSSIFEMDLRSRQPRRLTPQSGAIDTAPCYSPDGRQIVFESDREGSQELYIMNSDGSGVRRVSGADGGRYSTPVWSPRGDYIAFTKQLGGPVPDRGDAAGRDGRAGLDRGLPQRGADLGPQRTALDVLPGITGGDGGAANPFRRHHGLQREAGCDPLLRLRPGLVAAAELRFACALRVVFLRLSAGPKCYEFINANQSLKRNIKV